MTRELRRLSVVMLFMFIALFAATSWIQVVDADALAQNDSNQRTRLDSYEIQRGSIIIDGTNVATSVPSDDRYQFQRVYADAGMWAPVTGYFNAALDSRTGIEQAMNADLSGTGSSAFFSEIERILSGQPQTGFSVELSLDAAAQKAAYDALGGLQGAVVAIEPSTGRILAMVSTPGFDTNLLATHDADAANATYDQLVQDPLKPLSTARSPATSTRRARRSNSSLRPRPTRAATSRPTPRFRTPRRTRFPGRATASRTHGEAPAAAVRPSRSPRRSA